jgi:hypothetical protein
MSLSYSVAEYVGGTITHTYKGFCKATTLQIVHSHCVVKKNSLVMVMEEDDFSMWILPSGKVEQENALKELKRFYQEHHQEWLDKDGNLPFFVFQPGQFGVVK